MTRAHYVKAAAKDYPDAGIKKGEPYYWWKFKARYGNSPRHMSKTRPRPSQLTQSYYLGQLLEQRRDACNEFADALEGIDMEEFEADLSAKDECSECNGTGKVDSEPDGEDCPECLGDGEVDKDDPVNSDGDTEEEYWQGRLDEVQNESFDIE